MYRLRPIAKPVTPAGARTKVELVVNCASAAWVLRLGCERRTAFSPLNSCNFGGIRVFFLPGADNSSPAKVADSATFKFPRQISVARLYARRRDARTRGEAGARTGLLQVEEK